eukprot:CAMPEP_0206526284 /NCGR_PEP_ID=MMETSP0325_2-20121206/629_1 /ASSEMBLY_ACC=CAM_ASM_000347 /TAXON_ID=2866 /ORGANISM="Crypthecodinium cohnii, Strain Seligo" /LENGTH=150 /DNA_ID=CAMNT_0054021409 /DNA_START=258 /DNA_END=706 /DNA_ORIENTATION=-
MDSRTTAAVLNITTKIIIIVTILPPFETSGSSKRRKSRAAQLPWVSVGNQGVSWSVICARIFGSPPLFVFVGPSIDSFPPAAPSGNASFIIPSVAKPCRTSKTSSVPREGVCLSDCLLAMPSQARRKTSSSMVFEAKEGWVASSTRRAET